MAAETDCGCDTRHDERMAVDSARWDGPAAMSGCASSDTPASCYGSICAGRKAGDPALQSSWALPHHPRPGAPADPDGVRNALARLPQTQGLTNAAAAKRHLQAHLAAAQSNSASDGNWLVRSVPFELTTADAGDGLTLEGYAAVFNRKALIKDWEGEFEEQIAPGAFTESLARKMPVLMFEHGKHPLIGSMPLGVIDPERTREDGKGLFISARLSDNWLIQPVRDAVRDRAVTGMSFRFPPPGDDDQRWAKRTGKPDLRTLLKLDVPELGPVVFPAYEPTTAAVRSQLDALDGDDTPTDFTGRDSARSAPGGDGKDAQPGNGGPSAPNPAALQRDRAWLLRRPLP
jgi:HK97 family phage prohead protease